MPLPILLPLWDSAGRRATASMSCITPPMGAHIRLAAYVLRDVSVGITRSRRLHRQKVEDPVLSRLSRVGYSAPSQKATHLIDSSLRNDPLLLFEEFFERCRKASPGGALSAEREQLANGSQVGYVQEVFR